MASPVFIRHWNWLNYLPLGTLPWSVANILCVLIPTCPLHIKTYVWCQHIDTGQLFKSDCSRNVQYSNCISFCCSLIGQFQIKTLSCELCMGIASLACLCLQVLLVTGQLLLLGHGCWVTHPWKLKIPIRHLPPIILFQPMIIIYVSNRFFPRIK